MKHTDLERELEAMGRELTRNLRAHLDSRYSEAHVPKCQFQELVVADSAEFRGLVCRSPEARSRRPTHRSGPGAQCGWQGRLRAARGFARSYATYRRGRVATFAARLGRGRRLHPKRMGAVATRLYRRTPGAHAGGNPARI